MPGESGETNPFDALSAHQRGLIIDLLTDVIDTEQRTRLEGFIASWIVARQNGETVIFNIDDDEGGGPVSDEEKSTLALLEANEDIFIERLSS